MVVWKRVGLVKLLNVYMDHEKYQFFFFLCRSEEGKVLGPTVMDLAQ